MEFFRIVKIIGSKVLEMVKYAMIWLKFGVKKSFPELFWHTKYEPNRSIFANVQNFGPNYFDNTEKRIPKFFFILLQIGQFTLKVVWNYHATPGT